MTPRLSEATLGRLPADVRRFRYDRSRTEAGIVHVGIGAFHRAHQAMVFDDLVANDSRWSVRAASLRAPAVRDARWRRRTGSTAWSSATAPTRRCG